jgi:hypothetical protein
MATLRISLGKNNSDNNTDVPWYMEIIQNSAIVLQCFSTQADPNSTTPYLCGTTNDFDPTLPTVINYYNLGKLTNTINFNFVNLVNGNVISAGSAINDGTKGTVSLSPISGSFSGDIAVLCHQSSVTVSGVNYIASGAQVSGAYPSIASVKPADNGWVSVVTPNVVNNPWYTVSNGLTAPVVSATTLLNTDSLTVSGMQQGDIMHIYVNNIKQDSNNLVVSSTGLFVFPIMTGREGVVHFNYTRSGLTSPNSQDVTVSVNAMQLGYLTVTSANPNQPNYYVGEAVDVTGITSGATLVIGKGSGADATTENTDYTKTTITGGFRITFLIAQIYQFYQTKATFLDGGKTAVTVGAVREVLVKPIPSTLTRNVGETIVITNQSTVGYSNINVLKNGSIVIPSEGDYSLLGGIYTFLKAGSYTFVGQKSGFSDSEPSNAVVVATIATGGSGNARGRFRYISEEELSLFASGNINAPESTGAGYRWLKDGEEVYLETVISYVDQINPLGLSGIMVFQQEAMIGYIPAGSLMIGLFLKNDNSIGILTRGASGLQPVTVKTLPSKSFPIKLRVEKIGSEFVFSYSLNTGVLNDTLIEFYRTPVMFDNYCLALAGSSGTANLQTTQFQQTVCSWGIVGDVGSTN